MKAFRPEADKRINHPLIVEITSISQKIAAPCRVHVAPWQRTDPGAKVEYRNPDRLGIRRKAEFLPRSWSEHFSPLFLLGTLLARQAAYANLGGVAALWGWVTWGISGAVVGLLGSGGLNNSLLFLLIHLEWIRPRLRARGLRWPAEVHFKVEEFTGQRDPHHVRTLVLPPNQTVDVEIGSEVNAQVVRKFEDKLRYESRSPAMISKISAAWGRCSPTLRNRGSPPAMPCATSARSTRGKERQAERRQKGKLKVGVDIPTPEEIKGIIADVKGRWRPLLITAIFTGLRASELRGLRWPDVDLKASELHVRQRADRFNEIGKPKSAAGERIVPFGTFVTNTLKEWKLVCPKSDGRSRVPQRRGQGGVVSEHHQPGFVPAQVAGGMVIDGKAKYRDARASPFLCLVVHQPPGDGGLGLPPKIVQERLGHSLDHHDL